MEISESAFNAINDKLELLEKQLLIAKNNNKRLKLELKTKEETIQELTADKKRLIASYYSLQRKIDRGY